MLIPTTINRISLHAIAGQRTGFPGIFGHGARNLEQRTTRRGSGIIDEDVAGEPLNGGERASAMPRPTP